MADLRLGGIWTDGLIDRLIFEQGAYWKGAALVAIGVLTLWRPSGGMIRLPMLLERRPRVSGAPRPIWAKRRRPSGD